ncbi:MAG: DUF3810 domain-containing protein [Planctomycetes bacterium]|nr:DUF3810 domain-containing protein [Planctomycetota bacterium]
MSANGDDGAAARRSGKRRLAAALLAWPLGFGALWAARLEPGLVERWYSRGLYPREATVLRSLAGVFPVSLSELLLAALVVAIALRALRSWRRWRTREAGLARLTFEAARDGLCAAGGLWLAFLVLWGFSHARQPYAWHVGLELREVSHDELVDLGRWLVGEVNRLRPEVPDEALLLQPGEDGVDPRLRAAYARLGERVPALAGGGMLLRKPLSAPLLSRLGITGIFSPFTGEAHVNDRTRPWLHLFSAAHELAHQKGFAREDEANWIAWQVCRASDDPALQYSVTLVALRFVLQALTETRGHEALALHARLSDAVLDDLESNRRYWREQRTALTDVAETVNDTYLKTTGSPAGVRSYGRMVDGLVAEWRARHAAPAGTGEAGL